MKYAYLIIAIHGCHARARSLERSLNVNIPWSSTVAKDINTSTAELSIKTFTITLQWKNDRLSYSRQV